MVDRHPNCRSKRVRVRVSWPLPLCAAGPMVLPTRVRGSAWAHGPPLRLDCRLLMIKRGFLGVEERVYVGNEMNISLPSGDERRVRILDQRALLLQQLKIHQRDDHLARPGYPNEAKKLSLVH